MLVFKRLKNHRAVIRTDDIPLAFFNFFEENDKLATRIFFRERKQFVPLSTHNRHKLIGSRSGNIPFSPLPTKVGMV